MHIPVLLQETIRLLEPKAGEIIIDGTVGSGGHAVAICEASPETKIIGLDKDREALKRSGEKFLEKSCKFELYESDFRNFDEILDDADIKKIDGLLLDLGLNSEQLESSGKGFTFKKNEPLLMTYGQADGITARDILNDWSEETISNIIFGYGEERYAKRIAKNIIDKRKRAPIEKTEEFVEIIRKALPKAYLRKKIHFATKTFQALRIAVNDELEALKEVLEKGMEYLSPGGRIAVISFHSLEDRIVKNFFKDWQKEDLGEILTKKPLVPSERERRENPRSRSAKLRVFRKKS